ncbi:S8 family peptidase [Haliangium sp.]|uniref:S8 family peptidase n=1 Tax=Haliangium sp. TaxID=2663208 RepID=UPI003D0F68DD
MHRKIDILPLFLVSGVALSGCFGPGDEPNGDRHDTDLQALKAAEVAPAAVKMRILNGKGYTFVKYMNDKGEMSTEIFDGDGRVITEDELPEVAPRRIGRSLRAILDSRPGEARFVAADAEIEIEVALQVEPEAAIEPIEFGSADIDAKGNAALVLDGKSVTEAEMARHQAEKEERIKARILAAEEGRRKGWSRLLERNPALTKMQAMRQAREEGRMSAKLSLPRGQVEAFLAKNQDLVAGIDLALEPENLLSAAMIDTRVDPYALDYSGRQGDGVGVYMSEGGCPDAGHITDYTRLSGSSDGHSKNVSAIVRGVSPESYVYCRGGYTLPTSTDLLGYSGNPRVHIETHSWGYTGSDNDDYLPADRDFDDHVYDTAVAVFAANGNFGDDNGYTISPAKALNVISVGNYDDSIDTIYSDSSYLDSEIGNNKPELSAPGTSICAGGAGCWTGTSQASPHAAGVAADLMGAYSWLELKPYYVKSVMLAGSAKSITGGTSKVGVGGLDFYRSYYSGTHTWWEGGNGSFDYFDSIDYLPNNGYIDRAVTLNASTSNVRIALSWLNRGSYVYSHRADAHPIGMDMDLCVYDPNGNYVACSSSWDNPYEFVSFDPAVTGQYRIRISRYANRDTNSKLHMGLSIDW